MIQANWLVVHTTDTQISILRLDMMRLPLGILSGIGFIGAGAILRRGEMVRGLTTAATLWLVTVIGLCFGGGQTLLGVTATIIALATLWLMKYVEAATPARAARQDFHHALAGGSGGKRRACAAGRARVHTPVAP